MLSQRAIRNAAKITKSYTTRSVKQNKILVKVKYRKVKQGVIKTKIKLKGKNIYIDNNPTKKKQ